MPAVTSRAYDREDYAPVHERLDAGTHDDARQRAADRLREKQDPVGPQQWQLC